MTAFRPRGRPRFPGYYFLPEAALMLRVPLRYLRYLLYGAAAPSCSHRYARAGGHPANRRVLADADLEILARLIAQRVLPATPMGRPPVKGKIKSLADQP